MVVMQQEAEVPESLSRPHTTPLVSDQGKVELPRPLGEGCGGRAGVAPAGQEPAGHVLGGQNHEGTRAPSSGVFMLGPAPR